MSFLSSLSRTKDAPWPLRLLGVLGSAASAAVLIGTLTLTVFVASYYERDFGREAAAALVYQAWWFNGLFLLIIGCVVAAVVVRWPLKRHQYGFAVIHAGLVLLISGFIMAGNDRLDGLLEAAPGREAHVLELPIDYVGAVADETKAATHVQTFALAGYPSFARYLLTPLWPYARPGVHTLAAPAEILRLGAVRIAISQVVDTARHEAGWAPGGQGTPMVHTTLFARLPGQASGQVMGAQWMGFQADEESLLSLGPATITSGRTGEPGLVRDFLSGLTSATGTPMISAWWKGERQLAPVQGLPRTLTFADGTRIDLQEAFDRPGRGGSGLVEDAQAALNPVVKLLIHQMDGVARPAFVSAYSLLPSIPGELPELFYDHPALHGGISGEQGGFGQLLAGPDGRLHARLMTRSKGLVRSASIEPGAWSGAFLDGPAMQLELRLRWLPNAVRAPEPVQVVPAKRDRTTRWIEFEVAKDGETRRVWLRRGSRTSLQVGDSDVLLHYATAQYDLRERHGLAIRLERFDEGKDPGGMRSASYSSEVTVLTGGATRSALVTMNEPLYVGGVTLYQTSFYPHTDADGHSTGAQVSVFTVAQDHGRVLKYLGSLVLVAGMLLLYLWRLK